ncbi:diguanylate cyclase [Colwellia sp. E2M01]|uniref:diguanylate cyclase n=1 Tax=Colwellia sp. E2M01 TaxID=2841561 RepID=UPI001C0A6156|nr:diguanylate cyclase [Colwellia sp. E2M01]MBU2869548.1 diguanylate cyclase [Colwellia sp. E2M01]
MKQWFKAYLELDNGIDNNAYRKIVTSKFILLLSFSIPLIFMIGNLIYGNIALFYVNLVLFIGMSILLSISGHRRRYGPHFILHFMALGILFVVYIQQAKEYTPIWSFLYIFIVMSLYGDKIGVRICIVFLSILFYILSLFVNESITMMELIRFVIVSVFIVFFAYLTEALIARTFEKLIDAKTQLVALTKTDPLTGLFNRRHFDEMLPNKMSNANRRKELLALVIIDIDNFKSYNDTFGHPAGDFALISLADLLKAQMKRSTDTIFRIGGEEFALLYQTKNENDALQVIEDIRKSVANLDKNCDLERQITVSAGLLFIHAQQDLTLEKAYELADALLYKAKNSGRNVVVSSK